MSTTRPRLFDPEALFTSTAVPNTVVAYAKGEPTYSQGSPCDTVLFVRSAEVKLSVISKLGKEAIVAILDRGNFFGEGALAGQALRLGNATAHTASTIVEIGKADMRRLLHEEHALSAADWRDFVEARSVVDRTLREDPAGVYSLMDFATRDHYRHVVETTARRSGRTEGAVARVIITDARGLLADQVDGRPADTLPARLTPARAARVS